MLFFESLLKVAHFGVVAKCSKDGVSLHLKWFIFSFPLECTKDVLSWHPYLNWLILKLLLQNAIRMGFLFI